PWGSGAAPALNCRIDAIPSDADVLYLHDLALHPDARGGGWSRPIIARLAEDARAAGWGAIALVAVNQAASFWEGHGFTGLEAPDLAEKLAGYGPDARYMARAL